MVELISRRYSQNKIYVSKALAARADRFFYLTVVGYFLTSSRIANRAKCAHYAMSFCYRTSTSSHALICTTADNHRRHFALRESIQKSTNIWDSGERTISSNIKSL